MCASSRLHSFRPLVLLLAVFLILGVVYLWATPPLEASDELWHMGMVNHLADTGTLPVQAPETETTWEQEGSQPPLYYALVAALVAPIDRTNFEALRQPNPHAKAGIPGDSDNKNLVLHDTPPPALQGAVLAVYTGRTVSLLLACIAVAAVYLTALNVSDGNSAIATLAAGLTAFNPMFLFIGASVNNDNLVTALNSLMLWQMVVMLRNGFDTRRSLILALLFALASLSKLSGLVLMPVVALAALYVAWKRKDWRWLVLLGGLVVVMWTVLAGWWYARNLTLYGELFGTRTMVAVAGARIEPFTLQTLMSEFEGFRVAYWGWFGAVNITTHPAFYVMMDILTVLAVVGLVLHVWKRRGDREYLARVGLLALALGIGMVAVIQWTAQTYASQGRLLFPFVAAISTLLALGLTELFRLVGRRGRVVSYALVAALGIFAIVVPFATIAPQYAPPFALDTLPMSAQPVYARYGDVALVGYEMVDARYEPGDYVPITVYWQVIEQSERDLSLYLHAVTDGGEVVGRIDSYPGGGRLRTTLWQPGAIYADSYRIPLDEDAEGRSRLRVQVGWWHFESGEVVPPVDENGVALESVMLDVGGFAGAYMQAIPPHVGTIEPVSFGGVVALTGYVLDLDSDQVTLVWQATGTPDDNYTVFVQALGGNGVIAQGDAPPDLPTRYWRAGETYVTRHTLTYPQPAPPGDYPLIVGWYRPSDFARLETGTPDNAYILTSLPVE